MRAPASTRVQPHAGVAQGVHGSWLGSGATYVHDACVWVGFNGHSVYIFAPFAIGGARSLGGRGKIPWGEGQSLPLPPFEALGP